MCGQKKSTARDQLLIMNALFFLVTVLEIYSFKEIRAFPACYYVIRSCRYTNKVGIWPLSFASIGGSDILYK